MTASTMSVNTDAVAQFARQLEELAHDIETWVVRARFVAAHIAPPLRSTVETVSDRCARAAEQVRTDAVRARRASDSYTSHESWWAEHHHGVAPGVPGGGWPLNTLSLAGLGVSALAGAAAFLAPSRVTVSAFRRSTTGISSALMSVAGIAMAGARALGVQPTPIAVRAVERSDCRAPASFTEAVERIPTATPRGAQVRIEKTPTTAFVYIGGTVTGDLSGGREPWDMASNLSAMSGQASDSERGVRAAIAAAGVTSSERIVVVGHSQGGLIAQRLASDSLLGVRNVVLVGSPQSPVGVPPGVHVVALENRNDPIPALGGQAVESRADVTVSRTPDVSAGDPLAAHHTSAYRELASEADASREPALVNARRDVFEAAAATGSDAATCQASEWRVDRARRN